MNRRVTWDQQHAGKKMRMETLATMDDIRAGIHLRPIASKLLIFMYLR